MSEERAMRVLPSLLDPVCGLASVVGRASFPLHQIVTIRTPAYACHLSSTCRPFYRPPKANTPIFHPGSLLA